MGRVCSSVSYGSIKLTPIIFLTSFKESMNMNGEKYSVARFQPAGFDYPVLKFFQPLDDKGKQIGLSDFNECAHPHLAYREALMNIYLKRKIAVKKWLDNVELKTVLCCWCPHTRKAQQQMNLHGNFVCHTEVIGGYLRTLNGNIKIVMDEDRLFHMRRLWTWRPETLKI